jgi:hypothetical protein
MRRLSYVVIALALLASAADAGEKVSSVPLS